MAGTVKLPGFGQVKTIYVAGAGAVVLVIVGIAYIRRRNTAAAAASSGAASTTAAIDPQTGYLEGSPEDQAALQGGYGDGSGGGGGYYGGQQMYWDPADGLYDLPEPYAGAPSGTANSGPGTFTDNAYWVQYCIENVQGYSAEQIQNALGLYLSDQGLTTTQMTIYQASIAVGGQPPTPPKTPAHLQNGNGNGGGTGQGSGGGTAEVTVPDVKGVNVEQATQILHAAGLKASGPEGKTGVIHVVTATSPAGGTKVKSGTTVHLTAKTVPEATLVPSGKPPIITHAK